MTPEPEVLPLSEPANGHLLTHPEVTRPSMVPVSPTPMVLLQMAMANGAGLDQMERLMQLQERWEASEAKKAFVSAMAAFKSEDIRVTKDRSNKQYDSRYTSLGNLVDTVTPFLSKHGLSARWDLDQTSGIKVACVITHALGHSESVWMVCPPDTSGQKNPIQQIKSAITYAKACTFESICGLASTDANLDDDGNGTTKPKDMPDDRYKAHLQKIQSAETLTALQGVWKKAMDETKDQDTRKALINAKDARKDELQKGVK